MSERTISPDDKGRKLITSRRWLPVLGWCAATATGVAIASFALEPVLRTAVPDTVAVEAMHEVATVPQPAPVMSSLPQLSAPGTTASAAASPSKVGQSTQSPTTAEAHRPSPTPEQSTVTYQDGWTVVTDSSGDKSYLRTFQTGGGQAAIRIVPGKVSLVAATPAAGFVVDTTQTEADNLVVVFHTTNHSYTINALWWQDAPYAQVSEVGP